MLRDLKLQLHSVESLCDKAKLMGTISSIQEIYEKKLKESVLIGKIVEIGKLRKKDGVILRDSFELVLKELGVDGKYGNDFLVILLCNVAIEVHEAKFMLSDKLLFCEPQVFMNPMFCHQERPKFHVQVGLECGKDEVIWYSRKHSEECAVILASPPKKMSMKANDNEEPGCSSSNASISIIDNLSTAAAAEKNKKSNQNIDRRNKNKSLQMKNWISGKKKKDSSNVIHKRLLFNRNSDAPFLSDSLNDSAVQTDPEAPRSSSPSLLSVAKNINNNNNNSEKNSMATTSVVEINNQMILSKDFNRNNDNSKSPVKRKASPESTMKSGVLVSECDDRQNNSDGSQQNKDNVPDLLTFLEEVSESMKLKYLSSARHTKLTNESPQKAEFLQEAKSPQKEASINIKEVDTVTLDDSRDASGDDSVQSKDTTQQFINMLVDGRKKSHKCEHGILRKKKFKSNSSKKKIKSGVILSNSNSVEEKANSKQGKAILSYSGLHLSPSKASSTISFENIGNNNSKHVNGTDDAQTLNTRKENVKKKLILASKDGTKNTDFHEKKVVSNKTNESRRSSEGRKTRNNEVRNKHKERLGQLETSQTFIDDKKVRDVKSITALADSSVLTSPSKISGEIDDGMCNDNCKSNNTSADETTRTKLIPVLKSRHRNDEQVHGQPCRKKRVSFALDDEKNDEESVAGPSKNFALVLPKGYHEAVKSTSVLANYDLADDILNVVLRSSNERCVSDSHDCSVATQGPEKCRNEYSDKMVVEHDVMVSRDIGQSLQLHSEAGCLDDDSGSNINPTRVQKFVSQLTSDSQRRRDFGGLSCMVVEVNWPMQQSVSRDVCISTNYDSESDGVSDCDFNADNCDDPDGSWFVLTDASLIDIYPPVSGNPLNFISGFCDDSCFHEYSKLIWVKNESGESQAVCPTAFKEGTIKPSTVMFLFTIVVMDRKGKCYNLRVYREHAENLLGCKVTDFLVDKVKRAQVIANIKSYITANVAAESSATSEIANRKKLTLCVYSKDSVQIVVRHIQTSTLKCL